MMRQIVALILVLATIVAVANWPHVAAQGGSSPCDQTISLSGTASSTTTLLSAVPGTTPRVCAYQITGNTAATGVQFNAGSSGLTGVMLTGQYGNLTSGDGGNVVINGIGGASLTVTCTTGACTGWVKVGQY